MRILCATDLLPKSEVAIARARLMSDELGADLTLLHVVSNEQSPLVQAKTLHEPFARAKSRAEPVVSRTRRTGVVAVRAGSPATTLRHTPAQWNAQVLSWGPHDT